MTRETTYIVYWLDEAGSPHAAKHVVMTEALAYMQELREKGGAFVAMAAADPNSVGKPGVAAPDPSYSWPKRRSAEPLGRPK